MLIADNLDYVPQKVYKQQGPTCSAHTFFTAMSEFIQNKYKLDLEFDMKAGFKKMEKYRTAWNDKNYKRKRRIRAFFDIAKKDGWKTKTKEVLRARGCFSIKDITDHDTICKNIQKYGPCMIVIQRYEGHILNPSSDFIPPILKGAKMKAKAHALVLRGFDRERGVYKWHNSWGANSVKYVDFETIERMFKWGYFGLGITLE